MDEELKKQDTAQATASGPKSYSNTDAINALYDAQRAQKAADLEAAYNQNRSNAQAAADRLPQQYQQQANDLAVQYERNKRNFNERANMSGINTGAGAQAELASNAAWLRNYGNLRQAENNAQTEAQRRLDDLYATYTANLNAANAGVDAQRAAALIDENRQQYARDLDQAKEMAAYGDFGGYGRIYGDEAAQNMANVWAQQNPDLAYIVGRITKDQRDNIKAGRPINDGLDENGVRVVSSGGGGGNDGYMSDPWGYGGSYYNYSGGGSGGSSGGSSSGSNGAGNAVASAVGSGIGNAAAIAGGIAGGMVNPALGALLSNSLKS